MYNKVEALLSEKFKETDFEDYFLVDVDTGQEGKKILVFIDGDQGVPLRICQKISRYLESHFDEDRHVPEDYIIEVSSPGTSKSLKLIRQYYQHIGRNFQLTLTDGSESERILEAVNENVLDFAAPIDQRSKTQQKKHPIILESLQVTLDKIEKAIVSISFK